jgi:hypothetical protein
MNNPNYLKSIIMAMPSPRWGLIGKTDEETVAIRAAEEPERLARIEEKRLEREGEDADIEWVLMHARKSVFSMYKKFDTPGSPHATFEGCLARIERVRAILEGRE